MILYEEGGTKAMQADAHLVLEILSTAYPGHPWACRVDGGIVQIRHLQFANNGWGMVKKYSQIRHDANVFRREIIMAAGEFLERAGLVRGRATGEEIVHVEGVPDKYQPHQSWDAENIVTVRTGGGFLRSTPRRPMN